MLPFFIQSPPLFQSSKEALETSGAGMRHKGQLIAGFSHGLFSDALDRSTSAALLRQRDVLRIFAIQHSCLNLHCATRFLFVLSQDTKGQLEDFQRHLVGKQNVIVINPLDSAQQVESMFLPSSSSEFTPCQYQSGVL